MVLVACSVSDAPRARAPSRPPACWPRFDLSHGFLLPASAICELVPPPEPGLLLDPARHPAALAARLPLFRPEACRLPGLPDEPLCWSRHLELLQHDRVGGADEALGDAEDELSDGTAHDEDMRRDTLDLVLSAMGDALLGEAMANALDLPRDTARELATAKLMDHHPHDQG